jgi:hypothetical protein
MKNRILFILVFVLLFSFCFKNISASELCSPKGYTILTINGIFTDEKGALLNKNALGFKLRDPYNNEPIYVDYLYNPSHLAGLGDLVDAIAQGAFDQKSDYDLVNMLNDASEKVKTQKVLLVGHSQGNFYSNSFYDKVVDKDGGIPVESIGVYGVATPADHVAGGGKYLTSDTDSVIAGVVGHVKNILTPNTHIDLKKEDGDGHNFSNVYLKYRADKIVSDIKSSLDKLKTNQIQNTQSECISPQKISLGHKIEGVLLAVADPTANLIKNEIVNTYDTGVYLVNGVKNTILAIGKNVNTLLASAIGSSSRSNILATVPLGIEDTGGSPDNSVDKVESTEEITLEIVPDVSGITTLTEEENTTNEIPEPVVPDATNPIPSHSGGGGGSTSEPEGNNTNIENTETENSSSTTSTITDTTSPVITLVGDSVLDITKDASYVDAGATALDDTDGDLTSAIIKGGTFVDTSIIGTYTITYSVKDLANNPAVVVTRTVNIIPVPLPPVDEHANDLKIQP